MAITANKNLDAKRRGIGSDDFLFAREIVHHRITHAFIILSCRSSAHHCSLSLSLSLSCCSGRFGAGTIRLVIAAGGRIGNEEEIPKGDFSFLVFFL